MPSLRPPRSDGKPDHSVLSMQGKTESPNRAFVLVSTLLLIGLATILVVTAAMMSRVERKAASNTAKVDQARANALFALDVALNQLQREAGPDQRITARAEILDATNAPALSTTNNIKQPLWTGVWKTGTNGLDIVNSGTPQRQTSLGSTNPTMAQKITNASWLVSGTGALDPSSYASQGSTQTAQLAKYQVGASAINVLAPLVPIVSGTSTNGAYAYWVSDEGLKAKVNKTDPTLGIDPTSDPSRNQLHFLVPQAAAPHKGSTEFGTADLRTNTSDLPKITTLQSLANIIGLSGLAGTNAAKIAPDFTTHGFGVLADVRRGGLRKDLTAALESTNAFNSLATTYGHGQQMLYRSAASAGLTVPTIDTGVTPPTDGLLWHNLYFFYNSYKSLMPSPTATSGTPSPVTPTGSGNVATLPQVVSPRVYCLNLGTPNTKLSGLVPVPVAYRVDIALSSYLSGGLYKLRIHYYPQLVLWNPYGVRLQFTDYQLQREIEAFKTGSPYLRCIVGGVQRPDVVINQAPNANKRLRLSTASGNCNTLEPGETRVFALDADSDKLTLPNAITFAALVSNPNMSADYSQYADWENDPGTSNGGDLITNVSISNRQLRGQATDTFIESSSLKWPRNDGSSATAYNPVVRYQAGPAWDIPAANTTWNNTLTIQQLVGAPRRIIGFYIRLKGLKPSTTLYTYSNGGSYPPLFMGNASPLSPIDDCFSYAWQEVYLSPLGTPYMNGQADVQQAPSGPNGEYWQTTIGNESAGAAGAITRCILRDVPSQPLVSLGQFMHMPASNFRGFGVYEMFLPGSMAVGGSVNSPIISTAVNALSIGLGTASGGVPNNKLFLDDSYLANEALFDRFFLSTVPPAGATYPPTWGAFTDISKPLLNSRMKPYFKNGTAPQMANLRDVDKAAANLMLDGAFNINSTSVAAWKAFLGGLSGNDQRIFNASTGAASTESTAVGGAPGVAFSRFWSASGNTAPNTVWSGLRVLSDAQIDDLAKKIVAEVKTRGPFLSLADFLNRRLGPNTSAQNRCGALQSAIDRTSPDINATAKDAGVNVNASIPAEANRVPNLITGNMQDANGNPWSTALGVPGYLMQQDIVQAIAPAISARSDTFLIRTYGEVRNPTTGNVESRAWIEAVVQRTPDLFDASQPPETSLSAMNATNQNFGRRFQVISFRWLHPNEI